MPRRSVEIFMMAEPRRNQQGAMENLSFTPLLVGFIITNRGRVRNHQPLSWVGVLRLLPHPRAGHSRCRGACSARLYTPLETSRRLEERVQLPVHKVETHASCEHSQVLSNGKLAGLNINFQQPGVELIACSNRVDFESLDLSFLLDMRNQIL